MTQPTRLRMKPDGKFDVVFSTHTLHMQFLVFQCCDDGRKMIAFPLAGEHPKFCPFCGYDIVKGAKG